MTVQICENIVVKDIDDIKPYWRNPRKNDKTVEALLRVIPKVGFNVPLVVDKDGVIIKGHARYRTAMKLGMKKLPCIVSMNDDETNRLDRIADNKMSELAEWDVPELRYELEQIDFPLEEIGFDMPTQDIMDDFYEQEVFSEVKESDFAKAKQSIIQNTQSERKDVYQAFESPEASFVSEVAKTKLIKMVCPKCGEVFCWEDKS